MNKFTKIFFWLTGVVVLILLAAIYLTPGLINSELLKGKIESIASERIGGSVDFEKVDLSILPRPHAIIHKGAISREAASGTIKSLSIYPKILPLFKGKLQIARLLVKSPEIEIDLPEDNIKSNKKKPISSEAITNFLTPLSHKLPDLVVVIKNGSLNLVKDNQSVFSLEKIDSRIFFPPAALKVIRAEVKASLLKLTAQHESNKLVVKSSSLKGSFYHDEKVTSVSVPELVFDYPDLKLTGELVIDNISRMISLSLEGREVEVESTREAALAIAGDNPLTKKIFQIVKGGSIPLIAFNSQGSSLGDLHRIKNIVIEGSMSEGKIFIPGVRLNLEAVKGDVVISNGILEGKNLEAELENSHGREGSLKVGLTGNDAPFHLDVMVQTDMEQLHPLLKRIIKNKAFVEELSLIDDPKGKVSGRLVLGESLKSIKARVEASDVDLSAGYKRIPYPLEMNAGQFHYDQSGISMKNLKVKTGKSSLSDINVQINFKKTPFLEILSGSAAIFMNETYPWFSDLVNLPSKSVVRPFLPVLQMNMAWDKGGKTLKGEMSLQDGPNVSFDIHYNPEELQIHNLTFRDKESNAALSGKFRRNDMELKFAGKLTGTTVDNILSENNILNGWVKGDFEAKVIKDQLAQSTALGRLEGKDIVFLLKQNEPVSIKSISLDAEKSNINVVSADMTIGENHLKLNGDINASEGEFVFDISVVTDGIEWDNLKNIITAEKDVKDKESFYDFPVKGTVRLNSEYFTYDRFTFKPFQASITVDSDNINVADIESGICGISSPGNIELMPQKISLTFQPYAEKQELEHIMDCLFNVKKGTTGKYDLKANFTGRGKSKELIESLSGDMEFHARDGRIYRGGVIAKILAFINLTEIFRGKVPDLLKEGFAYKSMTAYVDLNGAMLNIKELMIDGSSMTIVGKGGINIKEKTIDLEILVAPLKTTDYIIKKIPLVREITAGSLISIPVKVKGDISNPNISYLSPVAVGSGLLGIMKNTIQAPFKMIEPIIPGKKEKE